MNDHAAQPLLTASHIHRRYRTGKRSLHVLKGVNLSIDEGAFITITGPSGAGKSTLLHILGGLDVPSEGSVTWKGEELFSLSERVRTIMRAQQVGFIFQFYHLLNDLTAFENIMLAWRIAQHAPGKLKRLNKKQAGCRARELLEEVGLAARAKHRPTELSGGEQQRVAIARAMMNEPDIIFCDEPTGNLDSVTGQTIKALLWRLNREKGITLVVVTHEQELADGADVSLHIRDGMIE